jgi:hypothetical protein
MNHEYQDFQLALVSSASAALERWDKLRRKVTDRNRADIACAADAAEEWMAVVIEMEKLRPVVQDGWEFTVKAHRSTKRQALERERKNVDKKSSRIDSNVPTLV